ncbi:MAG: helix-turn-helix domain-containing protein [Cellvibrionaceae bacterium]
MQKDFCLNLRLLCSYYRSIADVCRRLEFNRSQFNRYLNGRSRPTPNTLRHICNFFGVSEHDIYSPHEKFEKLVQPSGIDENLPTASTIDTSYISELNRHNSPDAQKYCGYYYEYYYSMSYPRKILRTLICMEQKNNKIYYQRTERLVTERKKAIFHSKYYGITHFLSDRIFMNDFESLAGNEITQTILYPSFNNKVRFLTGLRLGVSSNSERVPCCTRVVLEYIGKSINVISALRNCRLYEESDTEIKSDIIDLINNESKGVQLHFKAKM